MSVPLQSDSSSRKSRATRVSYYHCLKRLVSMYREVRLQESHLPQLLKNILQPGQLHLLTPTDLKRITKYWQLGRNIVCKPVYLLQRKNFNKAEENSILLLSVFAPFFDDLLDEKILPADQLEKLVHSPGQYIPLGKTDRMVLDLYRSLLATVPSPGLFTETLTNVFFWQKASQKQMDKRISEEDLYEITYNKSYSAVLLYCSLLVEYPSPEIRSFLYPFSGLLQLTNDIFDVWKDVQKGVYTLPNRYPGYDKLYSHFIAETEAINQKISELPVAMHTKRDLLISVHALPAMGLQAIDQLAQVTKQLTGFEELSKLSRKELVCDMDSLSKKLRWVQNIHMLANR